MLSISNEIDDDDFLTLIFSIFPEFCDERGGKTV